MQEKHKHPTHLPTLLSTLKISPQLQHLIFRIAFFCKQEFSQEFSSFPQVPIFWHPSLCESAGAGGSDNKHPHLRSRLRGRPSAEVSQVRVLPWVLAPMNGTDWTGLFRRESSRMKNPAAGLTILQQGYYWWKAFVVLQECARHCVFIHVKTRLSFIYMICQFLVVFASFMSVYQATNVV